MKIRFLGYRYWKQAKKDLGFWSFYILPCIMVEVDRNFLKEEYPTNIKFSWLFWEFYIYLQK
jgi:hypothetical protein